MTPLELNGGSPENAPPRRRSCRSWPPKEAGQGWQEERRRGRWWRAGGKGRRSRRRRRTSKKAKKKKGEGSPVPAEEKDRWGNTAKPSSGPERATPNAPYFPSWGAFLWQPYQKAELWNSGWDGGGHSGSWSATKATPAPSAAPQKSLQEEGAEADSHCSWFCLIL